MFALFGFVEAAKFRDSSEFSDYVQNVGGKVTKKILHSVKRPRNATSFLSRSPWIGAGVGTRYRPKVLRNVGSGSRKR